MSSCICPHPVSLSRFSLAFPSPMDQKWRLTTAVAVVLEELLLASRDGRFWLQIWLGFHPLNFSAEDSLRKGGRPWEWWVWNRRSVCLCFFLSGCASMSTDGNFPFLVSQCGLHAVTLQISSGFQHQLGFSYLLSVQVTLPYSVSPMCKPRLHLLYVSMYILLVLFTFLSP